MPDALPPAPVEVQAYTHRQVLRVIGGILLCIFLASLDQTVIIPAVPAMAADLNAFGHLSWIVTAYLLTSTAATPILGKLSDNWGRRALLLPGLVVFVIASLGCGFAQTLTQLIVARAVQGLGGAALMSMSQAAIADVVSPRERGRYQGYMASMWGLSSIAGPVVGGWVTDHISWRWIFWANLPLGLIAMVLCERALRIIRAQHRPVRIDCLGASVLVLGVTAVLLMVSWGGVEMPWTSWPVIALGAAGLLLLLALVWQERRAPDPILAPRLFGNATFLRGVLIAFFTSLGLFGATFLLPLYFQLVLGYDASDSGFLVMPFMLTNVVGAYISGQTSRRLGRTKRIVLVGLGICVAGFLGLTFMTGAPSWLALLVSGVLGIGIGTTMPSVLMQVQNAAERRDVGAATGSLLFLRSMGGAFGSTIVGSVLAATFNDGLQKAGLPAVDLGALRGGGPAVAGLSPARAALAAGFQLSFAVCLVLTLVAVVIAAGMKDLQLRSGVAPSREIAH